MKPHLTGEAPTDPTLSEKGDVPKDAIVPEWVLGGVLVNAVVVAVKPGYNVLTTIKSGHDVPGDPSTE